MDVFPLLHTPIRSRRDWVRVQQQGRQLAKLLQFPLTGQIEIGCRAVALAVEALQAPPKQTVCFHLGADALHLGLHPTPRKNETERLPPAAYRFSKRLPGKTELSREDFIWVIAQVQTLLRTDVLEVFKQQNEEVLALLHALDCCRNDLDRVRHSASHPSAA